MATLRGIAAAINRVWQSGKAGKAAVLVAGFLIFGWIGALISPVPPAAPAVTPMQQIATPTPRPTPTATPTETPSVESYRVAVLPGIQSVIDSLERIAELSSAVGEEPSLIFDPDWQLEIVIQTAVLKAVHQEAQAIVPPDAFASFHAKYVAALGLLSEAGDEMLGSIDDMDPGKITSAARKMNEATALWLEAVDLLPVEKG